MPAITDAVSVILIFIFIVGGTIYANNSSSYILRTIYVGSIGMFGFFTLQSNGLWDNNTIVIYFCVIMFLTLLIQLNHARTLRTENPYAGFQEQVEKIRNDHNTTSSKDTK